MNVIFKKVRWKNFLSTGNAFNEVDFLSHHTNLLIGMSGSGKSTLLDAVAFSLFDRPFRNINKDQLVNTINEKGCLVEIEFQIGTKNFLVRRGRKPGIFEIEEDGVPINQDAASKDYQKYLEKHILKFNFKSFNQVVVLGAANFVPFMQLKPQDRRTIIENILDIEVFSVMNLLLKNRITELKEKAKTNINQVTVLKEKLVIHEGFILDLIKDNSEKTQENLRKIEENNKLKDDFNNKICSIQSVVDSKSLLLVEPKSLLNKLPEFKDIEKKIESNLSKVKKELTFYEAHNDCPTCKQLIDEEFRQKEIAEKKLKIEEYTDGLAKADIKIKEFNQIQSQVSVLEREISDCSIEIKKHQNSIISIEGYIKKIEEDNVDNNKPKENIENERVIIEDTKTQIVALQTEGNGFLIEKELNDVTSNILKDGGVKTQIIKQYLPIINKKVNEFLEEMNFLVNFNIDENFNESIRSRGRDCLSYDNFSEGEKQRIDLALLFTWRSVAKIKNSLHTNLLILDEVFDSYLDTTATENVIQLLNSPMFKDLNIFVISHKETISDKFKQTIKFAKKNNFSIIE